VKEARRDGIHLRSGEQQVSNLCMLYHCHASNNGRDGYYFLAHDSWAAFCRGNHNRRNGITVGATNVSLTGLRLDLNGGDGARILSKHCRCTGNMADINGGHGFHVTGPGHIVSGNVSTGNGTRKTTVGNPSGFRIGVEDAPDERSTFTENTALRNKGNGFWLVRGAHVFADTNVASDNQAGALRHGDTEQFRLSARGERADVHLDPLAAGQVHTFRVRVVGASVGDAVSAQPHDVPNGLIWSSYVPEAGQVEVRVLNPTDRDIRVREGRWTVETRR